MLIAFKKINTVKICLIHRWDEVYYKLFIKKHDHAEVLQHRRIWQNFWPVAANKRGSLGIQQFWLELSNNYFLTIAHGSFPFMALSFAPLFMWHIYLY